jgi:phthalate 4,5-dioxygenase
MLTRAETELLVRTAPGTPCGELMRRYWQPVALTSELPPDGDPVALTVLHEDVVLFRDDRGRPGLLDRMCAHRGADLSYGRCEDGGLRCIYHGWLFDVDGRCREQPGEPAGSTFRERVRQPSYPCREAGGLVFAYMGPGEPPPFPEFAGFRVDEEHRWSSKVFQACNYLQANEGNLDQVHVSFLHRLPAPEVEGLPVAGSSKKHFELVVEDTAPRIDLERTPWGFREYVTRKAPEGEYLKVEAFVLPNAAVFPGATAGRDGFQIHWHVPIDDVSHWKYMLVHRDTAPLDRTSVQRSLIGEGEIGPDFHPVRNRANRYRQDRAAMRTSATAGFGRAFEVHDTWAVEAPGAIQDRTKEHLGYSDRSVIMLRRVMQDAISAMQRGEPAPELGRHGTADVSEIISVADVVPAGTDGPAYLQQQIAARLRRIGAVAHG